MSKQRKFNARRFFDGLHGHEDELAALFTHFGRTLPDPFTSETAARAASEDLSISDPMTILFYQVHDLAIPKGRDIIHSTAETLQRFIEPVEPADALHRQDFAFAHEIMERAAGKRRMKIAADRFPADSVLRVARGWCLRRRLTHFGMLDPQRVFVTGRNT